ncbi:8-oxoguanine DNA glycosylase [Halobacteriales archaeon SW_7_68_16]|nr:MAG: 8-oxoguanine DNA glycosylase [Halobacteriales archaeon SW_7_68_16]
MERGRIEFDELNGGIDLTATIESGQTYCWRREDGRMFDGTGGQPWYYTIHDGEFVRVRERDEGIEWVATTDAVPILRERLRLDDDLPAIWARVPDDDLIHEARSFADGLRIVRDPPFETLVTFICSAQMRVARIHEMATGMARAFGPELVVDGETYHAFPDPDRLAAATEAELRDLGLGYRAPYVERTAEMVATGEARPEAAREREYEAAREALTAFVGVGNKVADCVCLFSLGFLQAVPLDTWIRTAIEDQYPEVEAGSYAETSRGIRERFGDEYAGYVQTCVFSYLRQTDG